MLGGYRARLPGLGLSGAPARLGAIGRACQAWGSVLWGDAGQLLGSQIGLNLGHNFAKGRYSPQNRIGLVDF